VQLTCGGGTTTQGNGGYPDFGSVGFDVTSLPSPPVEPHGGRGGGSSAALRKGKAPAPYQGVRLP
jgi:hypothetical protein